MLNIYLSKLVIIALSKITTKNKNKQLLNEHKNDGCDCFTNENKHKIVAMYIKTKKNATEYVQLNKSNYEEVVCISMSAST